MSTILVTGGNAGIGRACCKLLASTHGSKVIMGSRSVEKGNAAIASIAEEAPETKGMISVVQLDVQDDASVKAAAESIKASLGGEPLFAIVNNAGAGLAHGVDTGPILDVNLYGVKRVCDAIVPLLGPKGSRIVNVGSGIGPGWMSRAADPIKSTLCSPSVKWEQIDEIVKANLASAGEGENAGKGPAMNAYGLSKATLMAYTSVLVQAYPHILTSTISPGFIDTAMTKGFGAKLTPEQGTVSIRHCLFNELAGNGWMYGSDGKRSPIDASREPGEPEYTDPTGRGW